MHQKADTVTVGHTMSSAKYNWIRTERRPTGKKPMGKAYRKLWLAAKLRRPAGKNVNYWLRGMYIKDKTVQKEAV